MELLAVLHRAMKHPSRNGSIVDENLTNCSTVAPGLITIVGDSMGRELFFTIVNRIRHGPPPPPPSPSGRSSPRYTTPTGRLIDVLYSVFPEHDELQTFPAYVSVADLNSSITAHLQRNVVKQRRALVAIALISELSTHYPRPEVQFPNALDDEDVSNVVKLNGPAVASVTSTGRDLYVDDSASLVLERRHGGQPAGIKRQVFTGESMFAVTSLLRKFQKYNYQLDELDFHLPPMGGKEVTNGSSIGGCLPVVAHPNTFRHAPMRVFQESYHRSPAAKQPSLRSIGYRIPRMMIASFFWEWRYSWRYLQHVTAAAAATVRNDSHDDCRSQHGADETDILWLTPTTTNQFITRNILSAVAGVCKTGDGKTINHHDVPPAVNGNDTASSSFERSVFAEPVLEDDAASIGKINQITHWLNRSIALRRHITAAQLDANNNSQVSSQPNRQVVFKFVSSVSVFDTRKLQLIRSLRHADLHHFTCMHEGTRVFGEVLDTAFVPNGLEAAVKDAGPSLLLMIKNRLLELPSSDRPDYRTFRPTTRSLMALAQEGMIQTGRQGDKGNACSGEAASEIFDLVLMSTS